MRGAAVVDRLRMELGLCDSSEVADGCIVIGARLLLLEILRPQPDSRR